MFNVHTLDCVACRVVGRYITNSVFMYVLLLKAYGTVQYKWRIDPFYR